MADVEAKWAEHANKAADGSTRMTSSARLDHMRTLSSQSGPVATARVFYTKAGTRLSAATLLVHDAVVDHKAYWASVRSTGEAAYLTAILNSAAVAAKISDLEGIGEAGTQRDFDNLLQRFLETTPILPFDECTS